MWKLTVIAITLLALFNIAEAKFINPMNFKNTKSERNEVIQYIKNNVKHEYCDSEVNMCEPSTLRMMEKANLNAFKKAIKATNKKIMDQVIQDYCNNEVDMCSYSTIWMMYNQNLKASKKSLNWDNSK